MKTYLKLILYCLLLPFLLLQCEKTEEEKEIAIKAIEVIGSLNFGMIDVGSSTVKSIMIKNTGTTTVKIISIKLPESFTVDWEGGDIPINKEKKINVSFSPSQEREYIGSIEIITDAKPNKLSIDVYGLSKRDNPEVTISTSLLSFPKTSLFTASYQEFTITNNREKPIVIKEVAYSENDIAIIDLFNSTIAPKETVRFTVRFLPTVEKEYSGKITIDINVGKKEVISFHGISSYDFDIYVAGFKTSASSNKLIPTYWYNLMLNGMEPFPENDGTIESIKLLGRDIYAAGRSLTYDAAYWVNKSRKNLITASVYDSGAAYDIAIEGSDVYISGYESSLGGIFVDARYWKNGVPVKLTDESWIAAVACGIDVKDGDVYTAGKFGNHAVIWWNRGLNKLTDGNFQAIAYSVKVAGSNVYSAGYERNASGFRVAKYWKNRTSYSLTDGTRDAYANSIYIDNNDVYVAGVEVDSNGLTMAKYWKNGVAVDLGSGAAPSVAWDIVVYDGRVFVAGYERSRYNMARPNMAIYWVDGEPVNLTGYNNHAELKTILVAKKKMESDLD